MALIVIIAVAAIRIFGEGATVERDGLTYAGPALAQALDGAPAAPGSRVLERFVVGQAPCRAFLGSHVSGIACRERGGWHLRLIRDGVDLEDPAAVASLERDLRAAAVGMKAQ